MSYEIMFAAEQDFLRVTASGEYAFDRIFEFIAQVRSEAERLGKKCILIDSRGIIGRMTEAERFQGGQKIAEIFGSKLKAVLLTPSDNITKLGELTAVNRGARFLVTDSEEEAVSFLKET